MTYQLFTVGSGDRRQLVGRYDDYDDAVVARGRDVLVQLAAQGGWWTRVEHVIVGPGRDGPETDHMFCTELGVDPDRANAPTAADMQDAREWLDALHEPAAALKLDTTPRRA
jgi:hypothetical protein